MPNLANVHSMCPEHLYTIGGLDWWTGLVDWTTGLIDFHLKHTEMFHNVAQSTTVVD